MGEADEKVRNQSGDLSLQVLRNVRKEGKGQRPDAVPLRNVRREQETQETREVRIEWWKKRRGRKEAVPQGYEVMPDEGSSGKRLMGRGGLLQEMLQSARSFKPPPNGQPISVQEHRLAIRR